MSKKYVFITGGVVSGLGKGITAASLGRLLKNRGYKVINQKFDPYINVDPGTMNPYEHGEVFVTDDGAETDLDLGHYERFTDESLTKNSSVTSGKIYQSVIDKERRGDYLGKTVQVIPHITNEIKEKIYSFENTDVDIVITELGGTVGDMEGLAFIEAIRQIGLELEKEDVIYVHVTLLPYISGSNELKSKPTQHSVKELQSFGVKPDVLVCRSEQEMSEDMKEKIALFCNVKKECVIQNLTADNLYAVPLMLEEEGLATAVCKHLKLEKIEPNNKKWEKMIDDIKKIGEDTVKIAIVGKYVRLEDSYLSVAESLRHGGYANKVNVDIEYIDSETVTEENVAEKLAGIQGVVVPGGFGNRGIQGKINTIKYVRENNIPFLGICLGMQMAVIEFIRDVCGLEDVNSEEFDQYCKNPVIHIMDDQKNISRKGGTMRLGSYPCIIKEGTLARKVYGTDEITERHRHRYEFNNKYREMCEEKGLKISGTSPDGLLVEMVEYEKHPYFIGGQFHPEFKSRPDRPAPLFVGLIEAAKKSAPKFECKDGCCSIVK
ncbi:MAG: CTP synthase [Clostridia bacterium]|nr:CTP synthase [Clostridia bacterium]